MAKPIPDFDLRYHSKTEVIGSKEKAFFDDTLNKISKNNSKDLILGTISGWITGVGVAKIGKVAAFGLGGGIILLHFASDLGYINVNWDKVRDAIGRTQEIIDKVGSFVKKNSCFSVGFVGGFFFGVASA
ncbi:jg13838 [Pararge aegeria aegeria]|uniref:Jg13838 protein n=1 Tax=Pararge aegeria aegeria TaxID=348720 RepID=A0A8S4S9B9_9NEOP|nr:jg13838 [Pararge aegeria aegeria]